MRIGSQSNQRSSLTGNNAVAAALGNDLIRNKLDAAAAKKLSMLKRWVWISIIAVTSSIVTPVSTAIVPEHLTLQSNVPASRVARLRHGINLSHWFAQSG